MSEKILITGGAGFLGSILTREFLNVGHDVTVLDSFIYNQDSLLDCCIHDNFRIIRGDVRDKNLLISAMKDQDYIIHLAALVGAPICDLDPVGATTTNLESTKIILSSRTKNQRVLYPNTDSAYGTGNMGSLCTEDTPLRPLSLYGKTKAEAEKITLDAGNSVSLRLATLFGVSPRMRIDLLVNEFVYRALTDKFILLFEGHFQRNFVHLRDVADAFLHTIKNFEKMEGEAYNVGLLEANLSKIQLCERIKKHIPEFIYYEGDTREDPDKRNYTVSMEKIEKTGFRSKYTLDMGINELIKAYSILKNKKYGNI